MARAPQLAAQLAIALDWHEHSQIGQRCAWDMDRAWGPLWEGCREALAQAGDEPLEPIGDWHRLKRPETPIEWAREHLAVITKHWNLHWQALALCQSTEWPRVRPDRQHGKIASHTLAMAPEMAEIREMLRGWLA